jgi:predicted PurR-regulated permease PerM
VQPFPHSRVEQIGPVGGRNDSGTVRPANVQGIGMNQRASRPSGMTALSQENGVKPGPRFLLAGMSRAATVGIFVLMVFAALHWAQPVLMPVILALVAGVVLTPILLLAARFGVPHLLTSLILVSSIFAGLSYAIVLLADPVGEWIQKAPVFGAILREKLMVFDRPLAALNTLRESIAGPAKEGERLIDIDIYATFVRPMLGLLTPALGQIVVFFATLFFFLAGRESLRRRFITFWGDRKSRLDALSFLNDTESSLTRYFATVTVINIGLGIVLGSFAWLIEMPTPIAWGILAFLMNFVPYLGAAVVIILLFGVGIMAFDSLAYALIAPVFYLIVSTLEGQFITPGIVGLRLALSPLLVFLSVAFWTWFWGPFGALLAVPLLIISIVALQHAFPKETVKLPE